MQARRVSSVRQREVEKQKKSILAAIWECISVSLTHLQYGESLRGAHISPETGSDCSKRSLTYRHAVWVSMHGTVQLAAPFIRLLPLLATASVLHIVVDGGGPWSLFSTVTSCAQQRRSTQAVICRGTSLCGFTLGAPTMERRYSRGFICSHASCSHTTGWLSGVQCVGTAEYPWLMVIVHGFLGEIEFISASETAGIKPSYTVMSLGSKHLESPRWWPPDVAAICTEQQCTFLLIGWCMDFTPCLICHQKLLACFFTRVLCKGNFPGLSHAALLLPMNLLVFFQVFWSDVSEKPNRQWDGCHRARFLQRTGAL